MRVTRRGRRRRLIAAVALACLVVPLTAAAAPARTTTTAPGETAANPDGGRHGDWWHPGDWPTWQQGLYGDRFNGFEHEITPDNVDQLELKWAFTYPKRAGTPRSQPAVVGDTVYFGGPAGRFYARDARTGAPKWSFDLSTVGEGFAQVRDSPSVSGGKVFFGDTRGYLYALNRHSGELLWAKRVDSHLTAILTSSPIVFRGKVYVGVSSGENLLGKDHACCTFRGHVDARDVQTGRLLWRHYTAPKPRKVGTWPNGVDKYAPSGAGVWGSPAIDPATRTLYVGAGQNYTGSAGNYDSVIALSARTGRVRWTRKMTDVDTWRRLCSSPNPADRKYCPHSDGDALDFDLGASPNLFKVDGRLMVGIGQKSGVYHVLDARTGEIVWQRQLSEPMPGGGLTGIQWGTSYDGEKLYIATYMARPGTLYAITPDTGHIVWKKPAPAKGCTTGGVAKYSKRCVRGFTPAVTTTPGIVWEGAIDGKMRAYSASTGDVLWSYDTMQEVRGVNGKIGRGGALSGGGGAVVSHGILYVQSGYAFSPYPNDHGTVLMAFALQ